MKKFNYKKWIVESKYGKPINEISPELKARVAVKLKENLEEKFDIAATAEDEIQNLIQKWDAKENENQIRTTIGKHARDYDGKDLRTDLSYIYPQADDTEISQKSFDISSVIGTVTAWKYPEKPKPHIDAPRRSDPSAGAFDSKGRFWPQESKDSRASLYERIEKHIK